MNIDRTWMEEKAVNIPSDNYDVLSDDAEGIQKRMNDAYGEWRIKVNKCANVLLIDKSYTWCKDIPRVCEILNIKDDEWKCIETPPNHQMFRDIDFIINLEVLKQMRESNEIAKDDKERLRIIIRAVAEDYSKQYDKMTFSELTLLENLIMKIDLKLMEKSD